MPELTGIERENLKKIYPGKIAAVEARKSTGRVIRPVDRDSVRSWITGRKKREIRGESGSGKT